jgi:hypothetical protein
VYRNKLLQIDTPLKSILVNPALWLRQRCRGGAVELPIHRLPKEAEMKKRYAIGLAFAGVILLTGFTGCIHGPHHRGFDEFDLAAVTNRIASKIDLSESQKAALEEMVGMNSRTWPRRSTPWPGNCPICLAARSSSCST